MSKRDGKRQAYAISLVALADDGLPRLEALQLQGLSDVGDLLVSQRFEEGDFLQEGGTVESRTRW